MTTYRSFDETTASDFKRLFLDRFPSSDPGLLQYVFDNPGRTIHRDSGSLAYDDDGVVKGIFALLPRRMYFNRMPLVSAMAFAMAVKKDADRSFFTDFIRDAIVTSRADVFFANTTIPGSRRRLQAAVNVQDGPFSCSEIRECELRNSGRFARIVRKVFGAFGSGGKPYERAVAGEPVLKDGGLVLACECEIDNRSFNGFWENYLKDNEGLVSSRTAEELRWAFAKGLVDGEVVLLTARKDGELQGYAFCRRTDETAQCWRIVDLIALKQDEGVLESLIRAAAVFLRRRTPALCLQITGFPMWVQPLLKRLFPKSVSFGFNKCVWACLNERAKTLCGDWVNAKNGWYGCPYDGDMCII